MLIDPKPIERIQMVKAMEFVARQINDEDILYGWLQDGVADGDITYGELSVQRDDLERLEYYIRADNFAELMRLFLQIMAEAYHDGGLYCNGIISVDSRD